MKNLFTAREARELAGLTVEEKVDKIFPFIKDAANDKKRELKTGWDYKDNSELWIDGGYSKTPEWLRAKSILEKLGCKVEFCYDDSSQFVNMYTKIEW